MNSLKFAAMLICSIVFAGQVSAEVLEARLPYTPNVSDASMVVFQNGHPSYFRGEVSHTPEGTVVRADVREPGADSAYVGVVFLADGRVLSSSVREYGAGSGEDSRALRLSTLKSKNDALEKELREISDNTVLATASLRKAAGLGEVDEILARASKLEEKIKAISPKVEPD